MTELLEKRIYTNDIKKYILYQCQIPLLKNPSKFDDIIFDFDNFCNS
jgi:hypothetical protein